MPTYLITITDKAAQGFTDAGVDPKTVIEQRANEIGAEYANLAKITTRKKLVQEIESKGNTDAIYAIVDKVAIKPEAFKADVDRIYDAEIAKQDEIIEPIEIVEPIITPIKK